jgi:hypothetical protein
MKPGDAWIPLAGDLANGGAEGDLVRSMNDMYKNKRISGTDKWRRFILFASKNEPTPFIRSIYPRGTCAKQHSLGWEG